MVLTVKDPGRLNSDFAARWPRGELSANGNATAERFVLIIGALTIANGIAFNLGHSAPRGDVTFLAIEDPSLHVIPGSLEEQPGEVEWSNQRLI
jgi:hypothetical protein